MPPQNHAAYLVDKHGKPLEVRPAPYTTPSIDELVVEVKAIAINPVDVGVQLLGSLMFPWIKYPAIVGNDVSGVVVEVGSGKASKLFRPGDRVFGHAVGTDKRSNNAAEAAFQKYTVLRYNLASKIPGSLSHEQTSVLPLGLSTAACGLFMKDYLALRLPKSAPEADGTTSITTSGESRNEAVIVWGGSTSVGSNAVQLAHAAGYEVLATASPKNFEYLKSIGASKVFDYKQVNAVRDIISALQNKTCAGAIAIGDRSLEACIDIVGAVPGRKFVSQASNPVEMSDMPTGTVGLIWTMLKLIWWNITVGIRAKFKGVSTKFIWGSDLMANEVGSAIYNDFLPQALATGQYQAKPSPTVVGSGLESLQNAIDFYQRGVSATKIVVSL
ncbi:hypothetical protein M434DRAFT_22026 [Hypoxylon sp. CO27-5]|nr:hypothetical protein M434DRAFT_22026 [Hypoxylon sp. CO27-5]